MPDGANFSAVATVPCVEPTRPPHLFLDIETRSAINLLAKGVYIYAECPTTSIILMSYAVDDGPISTWYIMLGHPMPNELRKSILNPATIFVAHNAGFERVLLAVVGKGFLEPAVHAALSDIERWSCTAARAALMGLPRSLDNAGKALKIKIEKDKEGYNLMLAMCVPNTLDPENRHVWLEDIARQMRLGAYCETDVAVERLIHQDVPMLSPSELEVWRTTERMNDRGISVDDQLLQQLLLFTADAEAAANAKINHLTKDHPTDRVGRVPKVTNTDALRKWLISKGVTEAAQLGVGKWAIQRWLEDDSLPPLLREVLVVRKEGGKSSTRKFTAILARLNYDNRIRGSLLYCGAQSTARFSSKGAQLQNLPRGTNVKDMIAAISDVVNRLGVEAISKHGPPLVVASEMARPVFVAAYKHRLARADLAQIEARVLAWIAGEEWKVTAFRDYDIILGTDERGKPIRKGPDLYTVAAAPIFRVHASDVTSQQRQIGKICELALGFQGGIKALQSMARLYNVKFTDDEADVIKRAWREANPAIVQFWYDLNRAAIACMRAKPGEKIHVRPNLWFKRNRRALALRVPSGGLLMYWYPEMKEIETPWGEMRWAVTYMGEDSQTHQWVRHTMYGGILGENASQRIARDVMAEALVRLDAAGLDPRLTVHDEAVCSVAMSRYPTANAAAQAVLDVMLVSPAWAEGLPIAAEASAHQRYLKA